MNIITENELKIANNAILLIKRVAIDISGAGIKNQIISLEFGIPIESCVANDKKGKLKVKVVSSSKIGVSLRDTPKSNNTYGFTVKALIEPEITHFGSLKVIEWPAINLYQVSSIIQPYQILGFKYIEKEKNEDYWVAFENTTKRTKSHVASKRTPRIEIIQKQLPTYFLRGKLKIDCSNGGRISKIILNRPINSKRQKVIQRLSIDHKTVFDLNKNERIEIINPCNPGEIFETDIKWEVSLVNIDFYQNQFKNVNLNSYNFLKDEKLSYLFKSSKYWVLDDEEIIMVSDATKNMQTIWAIHKFLFEFTNRRINYQANGIRYSSKEAFHNKIGDCSEFSDLLISFHRLSGIPSRLVEGMIVLNDKNTNKYSLEGHAWVEFLTPDSWIPTDPTWGIPIGISSQHITFQRQSREPAPPSFQFTSQGPESKVSWNITIDKIE